MTLKKPFYSLKISSEYCGYRIAINGCLIDINRDGAPLNMEYPVNQWLRTGENKIDIFFLNAIHPHTMIRQLALESRLQCELVVREFDLEDKITITTIMFSGAEIPRVTDSLFINYDEKDALQKTVKTSSQPGEFHLDNGKLNKSDTGEYKISEISIDDEQTNALHLSRNISLVTPFPEWAFFNGQNDFPLRSEMTEDIWTQMKNELMVEYKKLWEIVNSGNASELESYLKLRCDEYDQAFYTPPGSNLNDFIKTMNQEILDPEWELYPLEFNNFDIGVSYSRNILWLHGRKNLMGSAFFFNHKKSDLAKKFPFYYSKIDGEWVIVR